jgi:hypothetical protein
MSNWHYYMNLYVTGLGVVGGKLLTPGLLQTHIGKMMCVQEMLAARPNVAFKTTFMACALLYCFHVSSCTLN